MWTAFSSSPANATKVPTTRAMLDSPVKGGVTSLRCSGVADGLLSKSHANMKRISAKAGTIVPRPTPMLLSPAVFFMPPDTTQVAPQKPDEHHSPHVGTVAGQVRTAERGGQCRGPEGQQRRIERHAVHEHEPGRLEPGPVPERLADPDEDAALVAGRQLGRDQAHRQEEQHRRDQVDGDGAQAEGRRVRELGDAPDAGDHHHAPVPATRSARPTCARWRRLASSLGGAAAADMSTRFRGVSGWGCVVGSIYLVVSMGSMSATRSSYVDELCGAVGLDDQALVGDGVRSVMNFSRRPDGFPERISDSAELTPPSSASQIWGADVP